MDLQKEKQKISQILRDKAFVYKGTKYALDEGRTRCHSDNAVLEPIGLMKLFTPRISTFFWSHAVEALSDSPPVPFEPEAVEEIPTPAPVEKKKPKPAKKKKQPK